MVSSGWRWVEGVNIIHTNNFVSEVGGKFATFLPPRPARRPAARCAPLRNAPAGDAVRHGMRANGREMWCRAKAVGRGRWVAVRGRSRMIIDAPATLPDRPSSGQMPSPWGHILTPCDLRISYRHGDATARARCRSRDHPV